MAEPDYLSRRNAGCKFTECGAGFVTEQAKALLAYISCCMPTDPRSQHYPAEGCGEASRMDKGFIQAADTNLQELVPCGLLKVGLLPWPCPSCGGDPLHLHT